MDPDGELARRLTRLTALRLLVLTAFLAFVTLVYLRGQTGGFSSTVAFATVAASYALAGVVATALRGGRYLRPIAAFQIVSDQLAWTALIYVTGGVASGAVSLYGLTCVSGAILLGWRGGGLALGVALAAYGTLAAGLVEAFLPKPPDQDPDVYVSAWQTAAYPMLANIVGLAMVTGLASYLAERLVATGGDLERERARAASAERLAALGRLAAGLAHEIRNPLGSISGSVELLQTSPGLSDEDRLLCEIVQREAARLNDLVGDMLVLAKPREPQLETVQLADIARDVVTLAGRSGRGGDIDVRYEGPAALRVRADSAQLRQVLWNLVRNAVQASSAGDEVLVRLARAGDAVELSVVDHGAGIAPEARAHLFDAFFTTRSHGTGVGLAVVKAILEAHGFAVEVGDGSGGGAVFTVRIPASSVVEEPPLEAVVASA